MLHGPRLTIKTVSRRFDEIRIDLLSAIDRRLLVLNTLVAAAPLRDHMCDAAAALAPPAAITPASLAVRIINSLGPHTRATC